MKERKMKKIIININQLLSKKKKTKEKIEERIIFIVKSTVYCKL